MEKFGDTEVIRNWSLKEIFKGAFSIKDRG